jgi:hypothetical protein
LLHVANEHILDVTCGDGYGDFAEPIRDALVLLEVRKIQPDERLGSNRNVHGGRLC